MGEDDRCGECYHAPSSDAFMVQCDNCNKWYHGKCCLLKEWQAAEFEKFFCKHCSSARGPSKRKRRANWHRHDCYETNADNKPAQCGTISFLKKLKSRKFPDALETVTSLPDGSTISKQFFEENGFSKPFVINNTAGLNMRVPERDSFSIQKAVDYLGENCRIDIIDSERQLVFESTLSRLRDYFASPKRDKIYNVISLEFTGTEMEELVLPPYVVRELSWLPSIWPTANKDNLTTVTAECPRTERFLLMSAAGSYTDFHVDFGGSSVWYHIVKGSKIFYVAPPTDENLDAYAKWNDAKNRVEKFLGDNLKPCYKLSLNMGQTLLLPGGWIHSVVTPSDSIVFGGNFLHSLDIALQLRIYDLERRIHTDSKFLFPEFLSVNFFAARHLSEVLRDMGEDVDDEFEEKDSQTDFHQFNPKYMKALLTGCNALLTTLRRWLNDEKQIKKCVLPFGECSAIASEMQKSIRLAESRKISTKKAGKKQKTAQSKPLTSPACKTPPTTPQKRQKSSEAAEETPTKLLKQFNLSSPESSDSAVDLLPPVDAKTEGSGLKLKIHLSKGSVEAVEANSASLASSVSSSSPKDESSEEQVVKCEKEECN